MTSSDSLAVVLPGDRGQLEAFLEHVRAISTEADRVTVVLSRLSGDGHAPARGWPAGTLLAAADRALGAIDNWQGSDEVTRAVAELLPLLPE